MAGHLLVTNDFPPKTGGIQVYLYELWRRLEPGRAVVVTARSHPDADAFDHSSGMVVERVDAATLFAPTWRARAAIEAAIARHQPELVLLDPAWPLGLLGPTLSRPYGVVLHGAEVTVPGRLPVVASSLRTVLRHARVAVSAGGYPEAEARRNAGDAMCPVVRVAPGVDVERFHPLPEDRRLEVRRELGLAPHGPLVSSYSRLVPRKGMDTLIRASVDVARHVEGLSVAIGGAGRDRARLERLVRATSAPVTFLGRVPDDILPTWLAASDLMVMDCRSRWGGLEQEGFGIVFVEAAAAGVAAIAGRSGGSHEAVRDGETGVVVNHPGRVRDLAGAMTSLLSDPERRAAYGVRARQVAEATFGWDELARRLGEGLAPYDGAGVREPAS